MAFRPEDYDWERWLRWNAAVTKGAKQARVRAESKLVSEIERCVGVSVDYYYENRNLRDQIMHGHAYKMHAEEFFPTPRWIKRCKDLDIDVHPWNWSNGGFPSVDVFRHLMKYRWYIAVTPMTEVNSLLRIITTDGERGLGFGFEVATYHAEKIRRAFQRTRTDHPVDPVDEDVMLTKEISMTLEQELDAQLSFDPNIVGAPMEQRLGWMRLDEDELG